jgi:hypothetical protein
LATDGAANAYVADSGNHRIQTFDAQGNYQSQWGSYGTGDGQFDTPADVAVTAAAAFVSDGGNDRVQQFTLAGAYQAQWGTAGTGDGQFDSPGALTVAADGTVFVCDTGNNRVQSFAADRTFQYTWGTPGTAGNAFDFEPGSGIAISSDGHLHVADAGNARIQRFHPDPDALTFHGVVADTQTTLTIDPATWNGLTAQQDTFDGSVTFSFVDAAIMAFSTTYTETGGQSRLFRSAVAALGGGDESALSLQWCGYAGGRAGSSCAAYRPSCVRVAGLPTTPGGTVPGTFRIVVGGAEFSLDEGGGVCYLKGGSRWLIVARAAEGTGVPMCLLWDDANGNLTMEDGETAWHDLS